VVSTLLPDALHGAAERSADPPAVLVALRRLREELPDFVDHLAGDAELRSTLVAVFAASRSLTRLCLTDPTALDVLTDLDASPTADDAGQWKSREFLRIAARDLTGRATFEEVGAALADMSDRVLAAAFAAAPEVAVIAMGKFGGRELNYASDVDVMFVGRGDVRVPLEVARRSFRVDADLRPEGRNGPLVRTLNAYRSYWTRWAKTWEFQALLKARPCTGDVAIGEAFAEAAAAAVWSRPFGADEVREVRAMKARVEAEMSRRGLSDRELKRGRGGIRDVEFAVQLLQLVHGGADTALRSPTTLTALAELATAGYVDPADAGRLADTYRFLRMVEHRLQLWDEAQVHAVPPPGPALDRLARVCGYRSTAMQPATAQFMADLRRHQATARTIHERLFFRPLLEAFQGAQTGRGVPERLSAFGFTDAVRTQEALRELTRGLTRTSRLMHQMLPLVLEWLSEAPDPDAGLLGLRTLASGQHRSEALVRMFRDAPDGARRLCLLLGTSRVVGAGLERHPELVADLASCPNR
jgi:glutamate-ammonia-ligase adenylyltransferase